MDESSSTVTKSTPEDRLVPLGLATDEILDCEDKRSECLGW
jgi:hypothetical protein